MIRMKSLIVTALIASSAFASSSFAAVIVGTNFTGRTFAANVVTVTDYTVTGVASPGALTFTGPSAFMTSADATDRAIPIRNAPVWSVLIPVNVGAQAIALTDFTISLEAFSNAQASKTNISGGFSPNYQPTVRLLDQGKVLIDSQPLDAYTANGNNLVAAWTPVFTFVSDNTLEANTNYFIEVLMAGDSGNNVGIDDFVLNGSFAAVPEPSAMALFALGSIAMLLRRRERRA